MPKGTAKERRNHVFSVEGQNYAISIPGDYSEEDAYEAAVYAMENNIATPVRNTFTIEDNTPFEVAPLYRQTEPYSTVPDEQFGPANEEEINYAKKGVKLYQTPKHFSLEDTTKIGTAPNKHYAAAFIGQLLKNKWQADINPEDLVRLDQDTGDILFFDYKSPGNPKGTNRWAKYEGQGPWGVAEGAASVAGYAVGAIPGWLTQSPTGVRLGGNTGAGIAAGTVAALRNRQAAKYGVIPEEEADPGWEALKEGGMVAGAGLLADTVFGAMARPGRINSYFFDPKYSKEFEAGLADTEEVVRRIRELDAKYGGDPNRFNPSTAQRSGVRELRNLEATIEAKQSDKTSGGYAERIKKQREESERAIVNVLDNLLPQTSIEEASWRTAAVGQSTKEAVAGSPPAVRMEAETAKQKEFLDIVEQYRQGVDNIDYGANVERLRDATSQSLEDAQELSRVAWAEVNNAIGLRERVIPGQKPRFKPGEEGWELSQRGRAVDAQLEDTHFVTLPVNDPELAKVMLQWRNGKNTFFNGSAVDMLGEHVQRILNAAETGEQVPLSTLINGVKQLRSIERTALAPTASAPYSLDQRFLVQLERSLTTLRDNYMKRYTPDAVPVLQAAEQISRDIASTYYRTNGVKDLLRKVVNNPGEEAVGAEAVIRKLFPKYDAGPMTTLLGVIKNDAEAVAGLRALAYKKYVDAVINPRTGLVNPNAYRKFMSQYGESYKLLLDPKDYARMKQVGGLGDAMVRSQLAFKKAQAQFKQMFPAIQRMDAESIVQAIMTNSPKISMHEIGQLRALIESSPDPMVAGLWDEIADAGKAQLRASLGSASGNLADVVPRQIHSWLKKPERLKALFGDQYVKDLQTAAYALEIVNRKGTAINIPAQTPSLAMFRVIWGPLSRTQRFISASRQYQIAGYEKVLMDILSDPQKLRTAIKYGNVPVGSDNAAPILAMLGIQFVDESE